MNSSHTKENKSVWAENANIALLLFKQLRPKQWSKNALVFAALLFSIQEATLEMLTKSVTGFFMFCFISSCVYILNDFVDLEADRAHPEKRHRPMASGELNPLLALPFGMMLLLVSLMISFRIDPWFGMLLAAYFVTNIAYSFKLKHVVLIDVMVIAAGFVMRAVGGGLVIGVPLTAWFLICTMLLALFLAISKRRHEVHLFQHEGDGNAHRKVLDSYSTALLDHLISIVTTATIISYGLFTFTSGNSVHLMWTVPFVVYGIFRYLYLIHMEDKGGRPERDLLEDKPLLITVSLFALTVLFVLRYL